jgi:hypothetical protein
VLRSDLTEVKFLVGSVVTVNTAVHVDVALCGLGDSYSSKLLAFWTLSIIRNFFLFRQVMDASRLLPQEIFIT